MERNTPEALTDHDLDQTSAAGDDKKKEDRKDDKGKFWEVLCNEHGISSQGS
ncbi:MAG: hypothetical protein AAF479_12995 [Pseudomonadota bacterium]